MKFKSGKSIGNDYEMGFLDRWNWSKSQGSYEKKRDFFRFHWEVHYPKGTEYEELKINTVRFHVESPSAIQDLLLNNFKQQLVGDLLLSKVSYVARDCGLRFSPGNRISRKCIQQFRCTEAFRIQLTDSQCQISRQENIRFVHDALSSVLLPIVDKASVSLDQHFNPP